MKNPMINKKRFNNFKILFICKTRTKFYGPSFGLINSCKFICNTLEKEGIKSKVVSVIDNNCIDKEIYDYKPTHVFIEALWVVPSKFVQLIPRYPNIKWYVRIHSKIPFIANEGMAIEWLREYHKLSQIYSKLHVSANSDEVVDVFDKAYHIPVKYFPNIYCPTTQHHNLENMDCEEIEMRVRKELSGCRSVDIGCFGAIRPMKNQLNQALAAIAFGNQMKIRVNFHINHDRCETGGDPVLKNLKYAFKDTKHTLVFHPWMEHTDFVKVVKKMEVGMQVSMSETFNIVAADFVWNNVPLVGATEISWLDRRYKADPNSIKSMTDKLHFAYLGRKHDIQKVNFKNLEKYNNKSTKIWLDTL